MDIPFDPSRPTPIEEVKAEPVFETTASQGTLDAARLALRSRPFSERHRELGKMIKCQICGRRHRQMSLPPCEQKFTQVVKDGYEYFREEPKTGTLVPKLRTAIDPELQPTPNQVVGAAAFRKRRYNPHPNAKNLSLIERTRQVFAEMGFTITEGEQAQKNMQIARKEAHRVLRKKARAQAKKKRAQQKQSRKVNR